MKTTFICILCLFTFGLIAQDQTSGFSALGVDTVTGNVIRVDNITLQGDAKPTVLNINGGSGGLFQSSGSSSADYTWNLGGNTQTISSNSEPLLFKISPTSLSLSGSTGAYEFNLDGKIWLKSSRSSQFIGNGAGFSNTGSHNVGIGQEAGRTGTGKDNVSIGRNVMYNNTTGFENVGIGWASMNKNTVGSRNTAIGVQSLQQNSTGDNNTAVGWRAILNATSERNTVMGESVADRTTTGGENNFFGSRAGHDNRDGSRNCGFGLDALYALNTVPLSDLEAGDTYVIHAVGSTDWTLLGANSNTQDLQFVSNGVAGTGSGTAVAVMGNGNGNVAVGHRAGYYNGQGNDNIYIGPNAGNNTFYRGQNNRLVIENSTSSVPLLGGDFSTDVLEIGGVLKFSKQYPSNGTDVTCNTCIFEGTDGVLYKKINGTVSPL